MPKATINENRDTLASKNKVWIAEHSMMTTPPSYSRSSQKRDEPHLGS